MRTFTQLFLISFLSLLSLSLKAQVTEHFTNESNSQNFSEGGYNFQITGGQLQIGNYGGWTGAESDDYSVLNTAEFVGKVGSFRNISSLMIVNSLYISPFNSSYEFDNSGTVIIRGKKYGAILYEKTISGDDINLDISTKNGFTLVDLSEYNSSCIDEIEFEITGNYRYLAIDAFKFTPILPPVATSVTVPTSKTYKINDVLSFTVSYDQNVTVTGTPQIPIGLNTGGTVFANYQSGSGTKNLTFSYTVASGNFDADGISLSSALDLNGGSLSSSFLYASLSLNVAPSTSGIKIDGIRPTATIALSDAALKTGETSTLTFTFSEAVTSFTTADLTVANGSVTGLSTGDGGTTWTATFTPSASVTAATNLITLDNTGVTDLNGNAGTGTTNSPNYAIDTLRPTATITMSDAALKYGETSTVTFTFSEAVTDFATDDVTAANGSLSNLTSGDGGITWTATFTPTSSITDATNVITVNNAGVADLAGNAGAGSSSSANYNIDTQRPTATIALSDAALKTGETSTVTFTFSEWITSFPLGAISATSGTVSNLSTTDNITWTATFTPKASTTSGGNAIVIFLNGISDAAGNSGLNIVGSPNYTVDTQNPTATITSTTSEPTNLTAIPVTVTFNESVTNFAEGDITLTNATISAFAGSGTTYTFTVTPGAQGLVTVAIAESVATDAAGNSNTAATSLTRTFDSVNPTVVLSTTAPSSTNAAIPVTATFSEDVTDLSLSDFSVINATLDALSGSGKTYTFTATPSAQGTVSISLPSASVLDAAQLGNVASDQLNRTFDNVAPIISGVTDDGIYSSAAYPTYNEGTGSISSNVTSTWYYPPTGGSVTMQGDFTLVVTDAAGNSTTVSFTVSIATQTEQKESAGYLLYPNPCSEGFHINVGNQTIELTIVDLTGRMVLHQIVTDKDYVPTSQLKAGIYIVKAGNFVTRLIVK